MDPEFTKIINLCLIFSKDLKEILLKKCKNGKWDGLLIDNDESQIETVYLSKIINSEIGLEINPMNWQIVTTLQNIEKKWMINVYMTISEIQKIHKTGFISAEVGFMLSEGDCHPNLKWLIPMAIDFTVFGSSFNQILMK